MTTFRVHGVPAPGGSKRGFQTAKGIRLIDSCKRNKPWRDSVAAAAIAAGFTMEPYAAFAVLYEFVMPRPKGHFRKDGTIRPAVANLPHTKKPDCVKLCRAAEDALTGIVWHDDAQCVSVTQVKRYHRDGEPCGCVVTVGKEPMP